MLPRDIQEKVNRYRRCYPENSEEHPDDLDLLETYKMIPYSQIVALKQGLVDKLKEEHAS